MWKYVKRYIHVAFIAAMFMAGEVTMDLLQPGMMSKIVDEGVLGLGSGGASNPKLILTYGLAMIGTVILGCCCGTLNNVFVHISSQNMGNEMRKDCFRKIMSFSFAQTDKFGTGSMITRVTNDITQTQNMAAQLVRGMIRTCLLFLGSIFFIFRLNTHFGIIVLCALPFTVGCMAFCLYKGGPLFTRLQSQLDEVNSILQEDISGIRIIKACVRETYEKQRFKKANSSLAETQLKILVVFAFMNPAMNILMNIAVVLILLAGSFDVRSAMATPGTVMAAITYTTQLLHSILMLVMLFQNISRGIASWKRVREVLDEASDMKDGRFTGDGKIRGRVEFKNVSFTYPNSDTPVLKNVSLRINEGESVAIMGATGCGKTTLVSLIPRFYDACEGEVLVDGVNVKDYNRRALREKVAAALQKSELFSGSIRENIAWGNEEATEEEISAAAKIAQAEEFISSAPDGYDTFVAERGTSLSGGQKQRLSIARAVLKNAEILIFDDSTSALDLKTEADLYSALEGAGSCTKIIVAQRIASVRRADRIIVLENGQIAACGTHDELVLSCAPYRDICKSQMGEGGGKDD